MGGLAMVNLEIENLRKLENYGYLINLLCGATTTYAVINNSKGEEIFAFLKKRKENETMITVATPYDEIECKMVEINYDGEKIKIICHDEDGNIYRIDEGREKRKLS